MKQLDQILNDLTPSLIDFACRLVGTKSMTCEEQDAAMLVKAEMERLGYDEITVDEMGNVFGRLGSGRAGLMFDSHMDTVTVNDEAEWAFPPYGGEIRDGNICGRGAADMKCGLAASVYGAAAAKEAGLIAPDTAVYVSASTMEEDYDGDALKYLLRETGLRPGEKLYEELLMKEEGMQETANKLIHIGKPIEMDDALLEQQLKLLNTRVYHSLMLEMVEINTLLKPLQIY